MDIEERLRAIYAELDVILQQLDSIQEQVKSADKRLMELSRSLKYIITDIGEPKECKHIWQYDNIDGETVHIYCLYCKTTKILEIT